MRVQVIAVGTKMPAWVEQGCQEYIKRLPRDIQLEWQEINLGKRGKNLKPEKAIQAESDAMLAKIPERSTVVALDQRGKDWTTEQLASELSNWQMQGQPVSLLIGGPDGLSEACKARAEKMWSLSRLTLPHPLVRVLLAEQIYRAWSINQGHPYHR